MISWFEKNYEFSWAISITIAIAMFYISSISFGQGEGSGGSLNATLYHIVAYFFLAFFLNIALVKGKNEKMIFVAILVSIIYGFTDEIHQYFVPGRHASLSDIGLNVIGISLASLFYFVSIKFRGKTKSL